MAANQKEQYRILIKQYNIFFDGPIIQDKWPASHGKTFDNIRKLGRTEFPQYRESISADSEFHPWREQTRRRAERIADLATLCRAGRRNEAGWRLLLESEILVRFTIEVACRICRARLWRSELEAALSAQNQLSESLEDRRMRRVPCSCKPMRWNEDPHEQGVCLLFDDRAEEDIVHDQPVLVDLPKKERPDRVYGLRMTKKLERLLLWSEDKRLSSGGKTIGETIKTSPFRADGEPVIFPFLAVEAKSEKGRDGFTDIEVQTAFTIRTLLKIQQDLRDAAGEENKFEASPLVWFFSYKGEQWRVSAAFIRDEGGVRTYRIVDLWDGRIISKEGALQLLLIVDYIFDWARDIYRETIISELRSLSASDTESLTNDTDIHSKLDRVSFLDPDTRADVDRKGKKPDRQDPTSTAHARHFFDSPLGAIREAEDIQSRFMSLYITEDNLSELIQSMRTVEKARSAARTILQCLKDSWRVSAESLDNLESMWTGKDRDNPNLYSPTKTFLVTVTLAAYLSPSWEQIRELSCLAVSEDAIKALLLEANQKLDAKWNVSRLPYVANDHFVGFIQCFRSISVQENLLATVSRACLSTKLYSQESKRKRTPEYPPESVTWAISKEEVKSGTKYRFDAALVPDSRANAREFISSIYNLHKIGRNEPSSSILRLSSRLDKQNPDIQKLPTLWPTASLGDINAQKVFAVLSKNPSNVSEYAELCLFFAGTSHANIEPSVIASSEWLLQTRRLDSKPGWGRGWNNTNVKAQDPAISQKLAELCNHLRNFMNSSTSIDANSGNDRSCEKMWGPKGAGGNWFMSSPFSKPLSFDVLLHFMENLGSRGRKLGSITVRDASNVSRIVGQPSTGQTSTAQTFEESLSQSYPNFIYKTSKASEEDSRVPDGEPGPSRIRRGANTSDTSSEESDNMELEDLQRDLGLPLKRAREVIAVDDDENAGESSSLYTSHKRRRTDGNTPFTRDYLDENEFESLMAGGYFN